MSLLTIATLYVRLMLYPALFLLLFLSSTGEPRRLSARRFRFALALYFLVLAIAVLVRFIGRLDWAVTIADWFGTPILLFLVINRVVDIWQQSRVVGGKYRL